MQLQWLRHEFNCINQGRPQLERKDRFEGKFERRMDRSRTDWTFRGVKRPFLDCASSFASVPHRYPLCAFPDLCSLLLGQTTDPPSSCLHYPFKLLDILLLHFYNPFISFLTKTHMECLRCAKNSWVSGT